MFPRGDEESLVKGGPMKLHVGMSLLACFLATAAATTAAAQVGACTTPLFGVGPVNPVHGFPDYY